MNPTTQPRAIRTSVGMETPNQTANRARALLSPQTGLATSQTPNRLGSVDVPSTVPSTALQGDRTMRDVLTTRANLEQEANARQQFDTDFNALTGRIQNTTPSSPFVNPEQFLNRLLLRGRTDTQEQLDTQRQTQSETIRGFADEFTRTADQARQDLGVPQLQANLAETRTRIAERTNNLRQTLRDFEVNAERRGVAREFVQSERQAVQAQAAEELADLSIIEAAQLGNLNEARAEIDTILAEKRQAFDFENAAIEAEIARLESIDTRESQARSEQLQIALQERTRNIETQLANEREARDLMAQAAANGADSGTLAAIRNAQTPGEALLLAGPWIGRLDRMQVTEGLRLRQEELNLARDRFESESVDFGTGTITMQDGQKAVVSTDGTVTPVSQIDFSDPAQVDALPVSNLTKAVMQGFAKTKDLTPTQKGEVMSELQAIGFNPNTYVVNKLSGLVETWAQVPETSRGYVEGLKFWESKTNADVATFESQRQLLTREIARLFDVGVLSDQDVAAYEAAMPSRRDADLSVVISKAAGIAGAATGENATGAGRSVLLPDGRTAIVGLDGDTLLDPQTGKPLE